MLDWSTCDAAWRDPDRLGGVWAFRDSRVSIATLFENLEDGVTIDEFVEIFQGITLDQVRAVLDHAAKSAMVEA